MKILDNYNVHLYSHKLPLQKQKINKQRKKKDTQRVVVVYVVFVDFCVFLDVLAF